MKSRIFIECGSILNPTACREEWKGMDPVLWIRDILVRIQIRASVTLDLRIRILLFSSVADKQPTKKNKFFAYLLLEGIFTSVFKDKKSRKDLKN
jgi:hypothetical protein